MNITYLEDGSLQRAHIIHNGIVYGIDTIEADTHAHHIELRPGETLDTCGIADMELFRQSLLAAVGGGQGQALAVVAAPDSDKALAGGHKMCIRDRLYPVQPKMSIGFLKVFWIFLRAVWSRTILYKTLTHFPLM